MISTLRQVPAMNRTPQLKGTGAEGQVAAGFLLLGGRSTAVRLS